MVVETRDVPYLTRNEIGRRATDVLRHHGLESIPVDPVVLANRLGMSVRNAKFSDDNITGMIAKRGDQITLLVNKSDPPYRKRFTIAHELGHHFLHLVQQDGEFVDGEANLFRQPREEGATMTPEIRREIQANMFAAALLMPEDIVRDLWARHRSVSTLARELNVSEEAMGLRIDTLGLE